VDLNYASIESDEYYPLLHCYNGYAQGFTYTFWATEEEVPEEYDSTWSQADWDALMEANKAYGDEAEEELQDYILSYYESCLVSFIEWLEGAVAEQVQTKADFVTNVKGNLEQLGQRCPNTFEFGLKKQIDKGLIYSPDILEGTGSVDVDFRVSLSISRVPMGIMPAITTSSSPKSPRIARICGIPKITYMAGPGTACMAIGSMEWMWLPDWSTKTVLPSVTWIISSVPSPKTRTSPGSIPKGKALILAVR
jgi:hypothetical protein